MTQVEFIAWLRGYLEANIRAGQACDPVPLLEKIKEIDAPHTSHRTLLIDSYTDLYNTTTTASPFLSVNCPATSLQENEPYQSPPGVYDDEE